MQFVYHRGTTQLDAQDEKGNKRASDSYKTRHDHKALVKCSVQLVSAPKMIFARIQSFDVAVKITTVAKKIEYEHVIHLQVCTFVQNDQQQCICHRQPTDCHFSDRVEGGTNKARESAPLALSLPTFL